MTTFVLSEEESASIRVVMSAGGAAAWEDKNLEVLRRRLKKARVAEQNRHCCFCRQTIPTDHGLSWTLDHVLPRSLYPQFCYELENLAACCHDCNGRKGSHDTLARGERRPPVRLPKRSRAYTIVHPRFDRWEDHIMLVADYLYVPRSAKGTETIGVCGLYRYAERAFGASVRPDAKLAHDLVSRLAAATAPDASPGSVELALFGVHVLTKRAVNALLSGDRPSDGSELLEDAS